MPTIAQIEAVRQRYGDCQRPLGSARAALAALGHAPGMCPNLCDVRRDFLTARIAELEQQQFVPQHVQRARNPLDVCLEDIPLIERSSDMTQTEVPETNPEVPEQPSVSNKGRMFRMVLVREAGGVKVEEMYHDAKLAAFIKANRSQVGSFSDAAGVGHYTYAMRVKTTNYPAGYCPGNDSPIGFLCFSLLNKPGLVIAAPRSKAQLDLVCREAEAMMRELWQEYISPYRVEVSITFREESNINATR